MADLPAPGKRRPLTREQIITLAIRQASAPILCGCGCGEPLQPKCIDEHRVPRENLPADRCDHIDNRALYRPECSKRKTVADQAAIASSRHQRGGKGSQRAKQIARGCSTIKGRSQFSPRPFDKRLKKSVRGKVEVRS